MGEIGVHPIKLAQVPRFRLGAVEVDPPARQLRRGPRSEMLEPRVMQVLVLLAEARGMVVSREELIERCWDGRIVGENAINRVISRIRQAAADIGAGSFQLETITKVGYRIVSETAEPWPLEPPGGRDRTPLVAADLGDPRAAAKKPSRRMVLGGAVVALGVAGAGAWYWISERSHRPHPQALELYRRGQIAQRQAEAGQTRQAVAFFREATEIDPHFAAAWGGLALAYRHVLEGDAEGEVASLPGLIESAARRALELEPDNADAQIALLIVRPTYGNWRTIEAGLRRLEPRFPDHWFLQAQLGLVRYEVGRWQDGLTHTERVLRLEPLIPIPHITRARTLWALGRLQEAGTTIDAAIERWPANYMLWNLKFHFLLFNGRSQAAAAFVMNPETRPEALRPNAVEARITLARAAETGAPADVASSLADLRAQTAMAVGSAPVTAPSFVLLGRRDLALDSLERYYFGAPAGALGPAATPPAAFERRHTAGLFMPNLAPLRGDPRYAALLERTGLERYWRETGTLPDYRRRG